MRILGVSAFYHDSAAALWDDGQIIAAAEEERFTRRKHDSSFPTRAIAYCLQEAGIGLSDVDFVAFYDKPFLKFERIVETYVAFAPLGFNTFRKSAHLWLHEKLFQKKLLLKKLRFFDKKFGAEKLRFSEHHLSHAASAFYPSPFDEAVILTIDGVGEWSTTSVAIGRGNKIHVVKEIHFPHSLGLLYSAFTAFLGFKANSAEYKVMGLAPYGKPIFTELLISKLVDIKSDGSFRLDQTYFDYCTGSNMTNKRFADLVGLAPRLPGEKLEQIHIDLAASVQALLEHVVLLITRSLSKEYPSIKNLCLAGGVALNCVANGKVLRDGAFAHIWIQPASSDAGGALGAALAIAHLDQACPRAAQSEDAMKGSYLGPSFSQGEIEERLGNLGAVFTLHSEKDICSVAAQMIADGSVIGWFQGRMEFGPRALGNRSILGDPRSPHMQKTINLKIKKREGFRPFAPSILREEVGEWFALQTDSPYMLLVADVQEKRRVGTTMESLFGSDHSKPTKSEIPAVTHIDGSARIQTVRANANPLYYTLIDQFKELTGCPILLNTSLNVRGEPIVCTPEDAFRCLIANELDALVVGNCLLLRRDQNPSISYSNTFDPD